MNTTQPLTRAQREIAERFEIGLGNQWSNDAGKWVNRTKAEPGKSQRVVAEIESASECSHYFAITWFYLVFIGDYSHFAFSAKVANAKQSELYLSPIVPKKLSLEAISATKSRKLLCKFKGFPFGFSQIANSTVSDSSGGLLG